MIKKHSVLVGVASSLILMIIAISIYPGGSMFDKNSTGFDWTKNFISNLFATKALNGVDNRSRPWADMGMIFISISMGIFFIHFSKKIPAKGAANVINYLGAANVLFIFLIVTPLHGLMVIIASTLFLISLFYITIFILKTRLLLFKLFCIICLLIFYCTLFLYGTNNWRILPVMQKVTFISSILLVLALEYFTKKEDFEHIKVRRQKTSQI